MSSHLSAINTFCLCISITLRTFRFLHSSIKWLGHDGNSCTLTACLRKPLVTSEAIPQSTISKTSVPYFCRIALVLRNGETKLALGLGRVSATMRKLTELAVRYECKTTRLCGRFRPSPSDPVIPTSRLSGGVVGLLWGSRRADSFQKKKKAAIRIRSGRSPREYIFRQLAHICRFVKLSFIIPFNTIFSR